MRALLYVHVKVYTCLMPIVMLDNSVWLCLSDAFWSRKRKVGLLPRSDASLCYNVQQATALNPGHASCSGTICSHVRARASPSRAIGPGYLYVQAIL
jgi:hypothetical protein